nr:alpha/beta hydrolase [Asgard group archaeon]
AGIGKSGKGRIEYSFPTFALDIKAVIDKERLDDCIILGHGMGGNVALETAALLKDEIRGLIIVDSLLPNTLYYGKKATEEEIAEVALEYQGNYKEYYDKLMRSMLGGRVESKTEDWIIDIAGYDANDPDILRAHVLIMLPYDYHDILDQVTCPIQYILRGAYRNSKQVLKEQQNAIFIDDVGHLSNIEKPELFNKLIDSIVQELIQTQ